MGSNAPQPGPDAMARGCVPRELGDRPTSVLAVLVFYICEMILLLFLLLFLLFFRRRQYTAQMLAGRGRRGRGNLSRKAGKKGGEIWPPSQISSAHGGEVLQEFSVICAIRPFFLPSGFSSCCRGNKKSALFPASPSPQAFGRSIIILTFCIESCYIFVNTYKYFVGEHFILPFKGPGRYTRGVRTEA